MRLPKERHGLTSSLFTAVLPRARHPGETSCTLEGTWGTLLTLMQPDGYLTEERKAADDDHGFSTFFSETGMCEHDKTR